MQSPTLNQYAMNAGEGQHSYVKNSIYQITTQEYNYYNALGLPGDFHGRLLPKSSLHFAYCSWSLHWLTEAPATALNKGATMYSGNRKKDDQVYDAYLCQFGKDLGSFLDARAQELMNGGLMALLIPTVPSFCDPQTEYTLTCYLNLMGSCLIDMAKKTIIDNNNNYSIERFEILYNTRKHSLPSTVRERVAFFRAVIEKLIGDHFGSEIINEFFDLYTKKYAASSVLVNSDNDKTHVTLRGVEDIVADSIIEEEIAKKLDVSSINSFHIADYGCATGHNSFPAIKIITQAITRKISEIASHDHEFFVYFNDNVTNDFNTLFRSLPKNNYYHALGLPGDFHGRLLPKSSLHFAYCSWSLHWLTEAPTTVLNKGATMYSGNRKDQVYDAYLSQFGKDLCSFLDARAQELMSGGLMALLIPTVPNFWDPQTEYTLTSDLNLLGSCLVDMSNKGIIDEAKVDTFNLPYYFATPEELKTIINNNNNYGIERFEILKNPRMPMVTEKLIGDHFGSEIIDALFDLYLKKLAASSVLVNTGNDRTLVTLVVLKRETN
ncbi:hypothetical protein ACJIZ3_006575 [Penstemon smallii]|uniref:Uncharacterized protein n=1 Tax=Penstemon smallii TaxID=265156 RepID=A0ABD3S832_9LAMI